MELTIDQALQQGVNAHNQGNLQEAERLYRAILKSQPLHPDANHNLGVLAVLVNKPEVALPLFKTALSVNSKIEQFWLSYIGAMIDLGQLEDAKAVLDQVKSNGAEGNDLDKLEIRLNLPNGAINNAVPLDAAKGPSEETVNQLLNFCHQGKFALVVEQAELLIKQYADSYEVWNILGSAASQIGKQDQAILAFQKVISLNPDYPDAYFNMGLALGRQDKLDEAVEAYSKALSLNPDYPRAYFFMAYALDRQDKLDEAVEAYSKALSLKPDDADAYLYMADALRRQDKLVKAVEAFSGGLSLKPDNAEAYNNMGTILQRQDKQYEAIKAYSKALSIKPDYAQAKINMGVALNAVVFTRPNPDLQIVINSLLGDKTFVRPDDICLGAISLLKLEPSVIKLLKKHSSNEIGQSLPTVISDLTKLPLLLTLMSVCPIIDRKLEACLADIRSLLLLSISQLNASSLVLRFQSALALQCFTNEYIYEQTDAEINALRSLEISLKKMLANGEQPSPQAILCFASYKALYKQDWSEKLSFNTTIDAVFVRQVLEPRKEAIMKSDFIALKEITNKVSLKVREQYEENPYPRWVNLCLALNPTPLSNIIYDIYPKLLDEILVDFDAPNILIAGCGTGRHSIEAAARYKGCQILATDLSLSSLGYATRKTNELCIKNIEYKQADILDSGNLDRRFDVVESVGVLHHMDDPMAGWRALADCLKTGGFMRIGLYSELARQSIVEMREEIRQSGIGLSDAEIKLFRIGMFNTDKECHKSILNSPDLYSMSALKDLLFHVQEHRFTIPQIQESLNQLGLKFCGFEDRGIVNSFKLINTDIDAPYDLDKWNEYEQANPSTFSGMYQFWCQKIS